MFRNPRENSLQHLKERLLPSIGRAPTPPNEYPTTTKHNSSPYFGRHATPTPELVGLVDKDVAKSSPPLGRPPATRTAPLKNGNSKTHGLRQNKSILNFFAKADKTGGEDSVGDDDSLFFEESVKHRSAGDASGVDCLETPASIRNLEEGETFLENARFNESVSPVKRRRLDSSLEDEVVATTSPAVRTKAGVAGLLLETKDGTTVPATARKPVRHLGGFIDDASSDEEDTTPSGPTSSIPDEVVERDPPEPDNLPLFPFKTIDKQRDYKDGKGETIVRVSAAKRPQEARENDSEIQQQVEEADTVPPIPCLNREGTSIFQGDEFDGVPDFEDDEFFEGGEEMMERRWMEEQRMLEVGLDEDSKSESGEDGAMTPTDYNGHPRQDEAYKDRPSCPVCNASLRGTSESQASSHVNACLDGNPTPLRDTSEGSTKEDATKETFTAASASKRFQRAAIARPGQQNPFSLSKDGNNCGSAFSRLMSGHAEDAAWAEAAASELQSRGKPAYQRTCPFYKIMPGFYICVDAFRYGKVEGQNAYFLSHFHSDHYIGLTSSWCHGPVYCSKVTANLVRQQLRVDPKWVVPLEFEQKAEVPNTKGVFVTMIPANHCPGSSLFLFEKGVSKGPRGAQKSTRILHCGDFRACPAHVNHPLLKPEIVDTISGQTKQQVIDTCYLDTTYLTPKYAFPSQGDVIDACAQMCVSLSKEIPDSNDSWEKVKLERAGSSMTKFLEKSSTDAAILKCEEDDIKPNMRGRLLVVIGTYSIGKERICLGIAKALNSRIYAPPAKMRICACLEDPELTTLLTTNPLEAQVHMQTLMEIRAETLQDYLQTYKGHFARVVGFRPTGWNYRPPTSRFTENPAVNTVLYSEGWKSRFSMRDLVPQRGSTKESNCFGVPYSEHSSFRELTMFCCALRIGRVIPTVNVGSAKSRERMKGWIEKWEIEKKKNGLFKVETGADGWGSGDGALRYGV